MDFKSHNTCITEAEKYQGALYVAPKGKGANKKAVSAHPKPLEEKPEPVVEQKKETKSSKKAKGTSLSLLVPKNKQSSLYKIVKQLEKEGSNKSKKDILKNLVVEQTSDGSITLTLKEE